MNHETDADRGRRLDAGPRVGYIHRERIASLPLTSKGLS